MACLQRLFDLTKEKGQHEPQSGPIHGGVGDHGDHDLVLPPGQDDLPLELQPRFIAADDRLGSSAEQSIEPLCRRGHAPAVIGQDTAHSATQQSATLIPGPQSDDARHILNGDEVGIDIKSHHDWLRS
jgi:hypothetical protein